MSEKFLVAAGRYPSEQFPGLRNLLSALRFVVVIPVLREMSLEEIIALWHFCNPAPEPPANQGDGSNIES